MSDMWSPVGTAPKVGGCSISLSPSANRDATIAGFSRKTTITEEQLDLAVDYDSEVEDSLPPNIRGGRELRQIRIEKCIKKLSYENKRNEFWEYYMQGIHASPVMIFLSLERFSAESCTILTASFPPRQLGSCCLKEKRAIYFNIWGNMVKLNRLLLSTG